MLEFRCRHFFFFAVLGSRWPAAAAVAAVAASATVLRAVVFLFPSLPFPFLGARTGDWLYPLYL